MLKLYMYIYIYIYLFSFFFLFSFCWRAPFANFLSTYSNVCVSPAGFLLIFLYCCFCLVCGCVGYCLCSRGLSLCFECWCLYAEVQHFIIPYFKANKISSTTFHISKKTANLYLYVASRFVTLRRSDLVLQFCLRTDVYNRRKKCVSIYRSLD
jgi:hypothetical protein